ncbi:MAG: thiopurine S-methyltransferase [Hyphomicrobium sp.]
MTPDFWTSRWQNNDIGFHQKAVHDLLPKYWADLKVPRGASVLVPLCGKSVDMVWLADQGHDVFGIELSELAVDAFFAERGLKPAVLEQGASQLKMGGPYALICGDFFSVQPTATAHVTAVYDRASLVALPTGMRAAYARHLMELVPRGAKMLLISLEYDSAQMSGPPFSVPGREIEALFQPYASVRRLQERDVINTHPHFKAKGVTWLTEAAYMLERR